MPAALPTMVQTTRRCFARWGALYCRAFLRRPDLPTPCQAFRHTGVQCRKAFTNVPVF